MLVGTDLKTSSRLGACTANCLHSHTLRESKTKELAWLKQILGNSGGGDVNLDARDMSLAAISTTTKIIKPFFAHDRS